MTRRIKVNLGDVPYIMRPIRDVTRGDPPPPLDYGFLHPLRETLLYSRGGVGKGVIASYFAAKDTLAGKRIGILAYEPHPDEWFRRIDGFGGDLDLVDIALPVSEDDGWLHGPIWNQVDDIRYYCDERGIERLYIDSLMPATKAGGDSALADPSVPDDFYGATRTIGVPALVLGHLSASASRDNLWKPWGSVYWVNYSRISWSAWYDPATKTVELVNQKRNVYRTEGPYSVDWSWADDLDAGTTPSDLTFVPLAASATVTRSTTNTRVQAAAAKAADTAANLAPTEAGAMPKTTLARAMRGRYNEALMGVELAAQMGLLATTTDGRYWAGGTVPNVPGTVGNSGEQRQEGHTPGTPTEGVPGVPGSRLGTEGTGNTEREDGS